MILAESLGLSVKEAKTVYPTTTIELHGITVDTAAMKLRVPPDKVTKAVELIDQLLACKKVTLRQVQSIAGLLSFFTRALPGARCFIRRLFDVMKGHRYPSHHIRLNAPARADLLMWKYVLKEFNGHTLISHIYWSQSPDYHVYSDASGQGYGAIFGSHWIQGRFPDSWLDMSIAVKEFVPLYIAFQLWVEFFANSHVVFHVDNMSVVYILLNHTSSDKTIMAMLRRMVVLAMLHNVVFSSVHISGVYNVLADSISRFQLTKARQWAPWLQPEGISVPERFLPWPAKRLKLC